MPKLKTPASIEMNKIIVRVARRYRLTRAVVRNCICEGLACKQDLNLNYLPAMPVVPLTLPNGSKIAILPDLHMAANDGKIMYIIHDWLKQFKPEQLILTDSQGTAEGLESLLKSTDDTFDPPKLLLVMGVSGAGKTSTGQKIADSLGWQFKDADDFHSAANKAKMHQGIALNDEDRVPWLQLLATNIRLWISSGQRTVLACSALKASYRSTLVGDSTEVATVYLHATFEEISNRLAARQDHFMNKDLARSQFEVLEEPVQNLTSNTNRVVIVEATDSDMSIIASVRKAFGL